MNLDSLLVCSDDRALRVLRNVLGELEIHVEHCADHASAAKKLAQHSFEAVIVDCKDERSFGLLPRIRSGQQNRKSVAIAIIDAHTNLQTAFKLGANFVVYKPISTEKVKSSFRAARALMKRERRRSVRLEVNIPAYFRFQNGDGEQASIEGLSEGGISVRFAGSPSRKSGLISFTFALPDTTTVIEATGMIAWQDLRRVGIQFATLSDAAHQSLKEWLRLQSGEKRDPPIRCTLLGLSFGGCFLRTQSPFPAQTRVELLLRAADCAVKTEGKVRLMDPELGMGIEFLTRTFQHQRRLEELIQQMTASPDAIAEVLVEPEGLDWDDAAAESPEGATARVEEADPDPDPLLELFHSGATLTRKQFLLELGQRRLAGSPGNASELNLPEPVAHHRREPREPVLRPIEVWRQDHQASLPQTTSLIEVSNRGARVGGLVFHLKAGEVVHLISDGVDAEFQVIWVGEPGTPREGQIGLQSVNADD